jgi:hypothetical protein
MANNSNAFAVDLGKFADKVKLDLAGFRRRVTLGIKEKVERRSPVDTGRARSSWAVSDTNPSTFIPSETGRAALGPIDAGFAQPFDISYITSNLAYITALEFGHSKQAPHGMVRISLAEMQAELEGAFGEL